jgi:sugar-phosphatase
VSFAAVISDLDGVLVDSLAATARAWALWGVRHGIDGASVQGAAHGRPARAIVAEHVAPEHVEREHEFLLRAELGDTRDVIALPGAHAVLALPVVAIVTSCVLPLAHARIAAAGLHPPEVLVTVDQVRHGKPAPDPYLLAAQRLGVEPAECLVLEDAPAGVAAGKAAGMAVWAVTTSHPRTELQAADRVAGGLPEILSALAR